MRVRAAALAVALAAAPAEGALIAPCAEPVLFPDADVNLVVMPFALGGPDEDYRLRPDLFALRENETAGKLASLIQVDTLYSLSYPAGMAVVHLVAEGEPCGPEDVLPDLSAQLEDGHGLVLLWGSFLEEDGQIYVQSYLELFRKNRDESVEIGVEMLAAEGRFAGQPGQTALGFAPRILTEQDLAEIAAAGEDARKVWSDPEGGSVVDVIPAVPEMPFAYYVTEIAPRPGRMRIAPHQLFGGTEGWIEAKTDWPLREKLPELDFVDAAMGYLAGRIIADERRHDDWKASFDAARERSKQGFARFREALAPEIEDGRNLDARISVALSHELGGLLDLLAEGSGAAPEGEEGFSNASSAFASASELLPYQAQARNLEAIALAGLAQSEPRLAALAAQQWREALSLDPDNDHAARNLVTFYDLLLDADATELIGLDSSDVKARLSVLRP